MGGQLPPPGKADLITPALFQNAISAYRLKLLRNGPGAKYGRASLPILSLYMTVRAYPRLAHGLDAVIFTVPAEAVFPLRISGMMIK